MVTRKKTFLTMRLKVHVSRKDIEDGACRDANRCMIRVAVERHLRTVDDSVGNHHTRVDAGHIKWNLGGYRWKAETPKIGKHSLIQFDRESKERAKAKRAGIEFKSKVEPFDLNLSAVRGTKINAETRERKDQINAARQARVAAGQKPKRYTLRERIVGFA